MEMNYTEMEKIISTNIKAEKNPLLNLDKSSLGII